MSEPRRAQIAEPSWLPLSEDAGWEAAWQAILASYQEMSTGRVAPAWSSQETEARVGAVSLSEGIGLAEATREAHQLMEEGDLLSASARCFGYFNPTAAWPGVLADLLSAARNPQICVVSHAPASAMMERHVIQFMQDRLGFPKQATGNFTSGGSEANGTALLIALVRGAAGFATDGVAAYAARPSFYASADSHLAWIKLARAAGIGASAVRLVPTSGDGRMDPKALREMVRSDRQSGWHPVMVAATAGTTNAGMIDPLHACREICDEFDIHLHVDAAWAGALIIDPERGRCLAGIESADSVTIDAHKWLSVPMGAGMVFVRDRAAVHAAYSVQTGYMPEGDGEDAYITTQQWSRRFLGLRLWMVLRATGLESYQRTFTRQFELADTLRARLAERGWTVRNATELPIVLFDDARSDLDSRRLADALESDGQVWLGCVSYEGRTLLRACLTSFMSDASDLELLLDRLDQVRDRLTEC